MNSGPNLTLTLTKSRPQVLADSLLEIYSKMLGFFACHFLRISTRVKISQNEDTKELKKDKLSVGNYIRVGVLLSSLCEIFYAR